MVRLMKYILAILIATIVTNPIFADYKPQRFCGILEIHIQLLQFENKPSPSPRPDPDPSPYDCDKCQDKGYIVHGDDYVSPCPDCNPTKYAEYIKEQEKRVGLVDAVSINFDQVRIGTKWYKRKLPYENAVRWIDKDTVMLQSCNNGRCVYSYMKVNSNKERGFLRQDYVN